MVATRIVTHEEFNAALPPGVVQMSAGSAVPVGWLLCDGRAVPRAEHPDLYAAVGDAFGAGDGSTTFNLPDLRGSAPIGAGQKPGLTERALGDEVGSETHRLTHKQSGLPTHKHPYATMVNEPHVYSGGGNGPRAKNVNGDTSEAGGTDAEEDHPNMQPSVAVNFVIKY